MSKAKEFSMMIASLLLLLCLIHSEILVEASHKSGKAKASVHNVNVKEHSSNQISANEKEKRLLKPEEEQLYYLPTQTVFTVTETLAGTDDFSTTSPPRLTINPAPIQTAFQESTSIFQEDLSAENDYYRDRFHSECVSETPVNELESHLLFPSKDVNKESVIMSGHLEIASKTSSVEEVYEINNIVSQPSILLQGTILHSHSVSDL